MLLVRRAFLVLAAAGLAVLLAEVALRVHGSDNVRAAGVELRLFGGDQARVRELYELDPQLGFQPHLPSALYAAHGALHNEYGPTVAPGKERLLLVGDSVVFRGRLLAALRARFGEQRFEYWNGGVSGYNTAQELEYLRRHTLATHPDRIVLVFHPNDFQSTPISFLDRTGRLQVIAPAARRSRVVPGLFRHSHLYRWLLTRSLSPERDEVGPEIRASLSELSRLCRARDMALTVLVLPHLAARATWTPVIERRHTWILTTLRELGLEHFDLLEPMQRALEDGIDPQETPGDHAHPSDAVCRVFAEALAEQGFLARPAAPRSR